MKFLKCLDDSENGVLYKMQKQVLTEREASRPAQTVQTSGSALRETLGL